MPVRTQTGGVGAVVGTGASILVGQLLKKIGGCELHTVVKSVRERRLKDCKIKQAPYNVYGRDCGIPARMRGQRRVVWDNMGNHCASKQVESAMF